MKLVHLVGFVIKKDVLVFELPWIAILKLYDVCVCRSAVNKIALLVYLMRIRYYPIC